MQCKARCWHVLRKRKKNRKRKSNRRRKSKRNRKRKQTNIAAGGTGETAATERMGVDTNSKGTRKQQWKKWRHRQRHM
eukprot:COSAG06_NODE_5614_length_3362_cov_6.133006_2_plen_78_part_00